MNTRLGILTLLLCSATCTVKGVTNGSCTNGFTPLEEIEDSRLSTLGRFPVIIRQTIYPTIRFTCSGVITQWIYGEQSTSSLFPEMEIWQEESPEVYRLKYTSDRNDNVAIRDTKKETVTYNLTRPVPVEVNDVFGLRYRNPSQRIRISIKLADYGDRMAPVHYFRQRANNTFNINATGTLVDRYFPLVTAVVSAASCSPSSLPTAQPTPVLVPDRGSEDDFLQTSTQQQLSSSSGPLQSLTISTQHLSTSSGPLQIITSHPLPIASTRAFLTTRALGTSTATTPLSSTPSLVPATNSPPVIISNTINQNVSVIIIVSVLFVIGFGAVSAVSGCVIFAGIHKFHFRRKGTTPKQQNSQPQDIDLGSLEINELYERVNSPISQLSQHQPQASSSLSKATRQDVELGRLETNQLIDVVTTTLLQQCKLTSNKDSDGIVTKPNKAYDHKRGRLMDQVRYSDIVMKQNKAYQPSEDGQLQDSQEYAYVKEPPEYAIPEGFLDLNL